MKPFSSALLPTLALALFVPASSEAQFTPSRCADCHFANSDAGRRWHLAEWDHSAHGRSNVGCERCHGGDSTTFESFRAHQGMLGSGNPASPIHRTNLPRTCGACHPGPFAAFQKSKHYELLGEGNPDTPTCVTCHGEVGAYLLSPKSLFAECARCHGTIKSAASADFPVEARMLLSGVFEVRELLDQAKELVGRIKEKDRRALLLAELEGARAPLTEVVEAAHMFVFEKTQERLQAARKRAEFLLEELANPTPATGK